MTPKQLLRYSILLFVAHLLNISCWAFSMTKLVDAVTNGPSAHVWLYGGLVCGTSLLFVVGRWAHRRFDRLLRLEILFQRWKNALDSAESCVETDRASAFAAFEHAKILRDECRHLLRQIGGSAIKIAEAIETDEEKSDGQR